MDTGDVVQDVLIRAIRWFPDFQVRHEHSFPAYLRTILANRLLNLGRVDARRPPPRPLDDAIDPPAGESFSVRCRCCRRAAAAGSTPP